MYLLHLSVNCPTDVDIEHKLDFGNSSLKFLAAILNFESTVLGERSGARERKMHKMFFFFHFTISIDKNFDNLNKVKGIVKRKTKMLQIIFKVYKNQYTLRH